MYIADPPNSISDTFIIPAESRERFLPLRAPTLAALRPFGVEMAGISAVAPPFAIGRQAHAFHLVLMTIAGEAAFRSEGDRGSMRAGESWVLPAGRPHHYQPRGRWVFAWFHLADSDRWSLLRGETVQPLSFPHQGQLHAAMEGLLAETLLPDADQAVTCPAYAHLIGLLLERLLRRFADPDAAERHRALNELKAAIAAQPAYPWSTEALAERLHVSPATLKRLLYSLDGATPMALVTRLRMQRAYELLHSTPYPLARIALLVGYATPFAFSRAFKHYAGMSPKAYRAANNG